jgi:hypothetical protein
MGETFRHGCRDYSCRAGYQSSHRNLAVKPSLDYVPSNDLSRLNRTGMVVLGDEKSHLVLSVFSTYLALSGGKI